MSKLKFCLLGVCTIFALMACDNPMYKGVVSQEDFEIIQKEELKGLAIVEAPSAKPVYLQFTKEGVVLVEDKASKNWHLSSNDATWRFSSNSGTTATIVGSDGTGGVKVFTAPFGDITDINHTEGLVNSTNTWEEDKLWKYSGSDYNLNYYLTKDLTSNNQGTPSETYLFYFNSSGMTSGQSTYLAGTEWTYLIKDGNGKNHVKIQPIRMSTDGSGMTFNNRIYMFNYEMAQPDGTFVGDEL